MAEQANVDEWNEFECEILGREPYSEGALKCPACGSENIHLGGVRSIIGISDTKGTILAQRVADGDFPFETNVDPVVGWRGAQVEIGLICERCRKPTVLGLQFHKGSTFMKWKKLSVPVPPDDSWDIWRD